MQLAYVIDVIAGVTLVECVVTNPRDTSRRITVTSRLDGPIWVPRRFGTALSEWSGVDGATDPMVQTIVAPRERVSIGFAAAANPVTPPVSIVEESAAAEETETTALDVLIECGDPRPPEDVVNDPSPSSAHSSDGQPTGPRR